MDQQPSIDRDILIPIVIGGLSVLGIILVLLIGRHNSLQANIPASPTERLFQYLYLGTEPATVKPIAAESETAQPTNAPGPFFSPTARPTILTPIVTGPNVTNTSTPSTGIILRTRTPTNLPTSIFTSTPGATIYDDTDFRFMYTGNWVSQTNVNGAYQGTLHVSSTVGDSMTFTFIGQQIKFSYQAGPSLGIVTFTIDSAGANLDQSDSTTQIKEWASGVIPQGTHTVVIMHFSGGSVNIDSLTIPETTTRTPTATFTPTQ